MIAVYGGTFDPPHEGHLQVYRALESLYSFSKFYFVPNYQNPLKAIGPQISPEDRLLLLETAIAELPKDKVSTLPWELLHHGPSYTVETLRRLKQESGEEIALIIGNEVFRDFAKWKAPTEILSLANLIVIEREAENVWSPTQILHQIGIKQVEAFSKNRWFLEGKKSWLDFQKISVVKVSSTQVRERIAECWKTNDLSKAPLGVQRSVWLLIKEKHLYCR